MRATDRLMRALSALGAMAISLEEARVAFVRMNVAMKTASEAMFPVRQIWFDMKHRRKWEKQLDRAHAAFMRNQRWRLEQNRRGAA